MTSEIRQAAMANISNNRGNSFWIKKQEVRTFCAGKLLELRSARGKETEATCLKPPVNDAEKNNFTRSGQHPEETEVTRFKPPVNGAKKNTRK